VKRILIGIVLVMMIVGGVAHSTSAPPTVEAQGTNVFVNVTPTDELQQGRVYMVRVQGAGLVKVNATFIGQRIELYRTTSGDWAGFLSVGMTDSVGGHMLEVYYWTAEDDLPQTTSRQLTVLFGNFDVQDIPIPFELQPLLDQDLNERNFAMIARVHERNSSEIFFTAFSQPVPGPVISGFGQIRTYNDGVLEGRHTGIDYPAVRGTPVTAVSSGRVVFAQALPIHGNHVIIDHGWGILSGYSHLSEISVVPGELVLAGQIIGLSGATGRVQGPHLHFELAVNGAWVDAQSFFALDIPLPAATQS
jgi:hypothetical protein